MQIDNPANSFAFLLTHTPLSYYCSRILLLLKQTKTVFP